MKALVRICAFVLLGTAAWQVGSLFESLNISILSSVGLAWLSICFLSGCGLESLLNLILD